MTYIELFDKSVIENLCTSLANPPDRLVMVGFNGNVLERHKERYEKLFSNRGISTEIVCKTVIRNDLREIVNNLCELVETYPDCVFDLTGGDDLYLVALGILHEKYKDRHIQMHRVNIVNGMVSDCDFDGTNVFNGDKIKISAEELITAAGGDIVYSNRRNDGTFRWNMTDDFKNDILNMWTICGRNPGTWNKQINVFSEAEQNGSVDKNSLTTSIDLNALKEIIRRKDEKYAFIKGVVFRLLKAGVLKKCSESDGKLIIQYKNEQVKRCLTTAGLVLEMYVYLYLLDSKTGNVPEYNSVMNGVLIDWDGVIHTDGSDILNEIDIIAVHDMVPVFISCKNGKFDSNELNKFYTVSEKFGGKYCKKILIATSLGNSKADNLLRLRAKEMKIRFVENIQDYSEAKMKRTVKYFWKA